MINLLAKGLKALNSDDSPWQISLALCLGLLVGLTPLLTVHNMFLLLLVLIVRVNLGVFSLSLGIFSGVAYVIDPLSEGFGFWLLPVESLQSFWTAMYQISFWRLLQFNNSLVLGSLCLCLLLVPAVFIGSKVLIEQYRLTIMSWVQRRRLIVWLKSSRVFSAYLLLNDRSAK
jgi:uncharacterized protein (TIGR03546 family)